MNESFLVRLIRSGELWPVRAAGREGVTLAEPDPYARRLRLEFDGRGPVTAFRLESIRRLYDDWHPWEFKLQSSVADDGLLFRGLDERSLPHGLYYCRLWIEDTTTARRRRDFSIEENGRTIVDVDVVPDARTVVVDLEESDDRIATVLDRPGVIEGVPLRDWLAGPDPRPKRKACVLNLLAALRVRPLVAAPFLDHVERLFFAAVDRVYGAVDEGLLPRLQELSDDPTRPVYAEGRPHAKIHERLLENLPVAEDRVAGYTLHSFRVEGRPSLQMVVAEPPAGHARRHYAEFDLDLGNPLQDVAGFAIHIGELAGSGPTDHLELRERLARTPAGRFLYYTIAEA